MRARLEEWAEEQLEETLRALGGALAAERAVVVGTGEFAELELVPDHDVRLKAVREIYDRALGKPVATNLIGGADTGPVEVDVPTTADRIKEVAEVLRDLGLEDV